MSQGFTLPMITGLQASLNLKADITAVNVANSPYVMTALNASGSAPIYACRGYVKFNGTGTPAIIASANVTSITDNGVGLYTINITTALPDANFSWSGSTDYNNTGGVLGAVCRQRNTTITTSALPIETSYGNGTVFDYAEICVHMFR